MLVISIDDHLHVRLVVLPVVNRTRTKFELIARFGFGTKKVGGEFFINMYNSFGVRTIQLISSPFAFIKNEDSLDSNPIILDVELIVIVISRRQSNTVHIVTIFYRCQYRPMTLRLLNANSS